MDARSPSVGSAVEASGGDSALVVAAKAAEEKSRMLRYLIACLIASQTVAHADQLILFHRDGCAPCAKAKAALIADPSLLGGIDLAFVDTKRHPRMASEYGVKSVPVLVLERDGREVARKVGWRDASEFREWFKGVSK